MSHYIDEAVSLLVCASDDLQSRLDIARGDVDAAADKLVKAQERRNRLESSLRAVTCALGELRCGEDDV